MRFYRAVLLLLGFSVPISTALDNLLMALLLVSGLLISGKNALEIALRHPVARAAWLLFGALLVAVFYGAAPLREAVDTLGKYADLAMIPIYIAAMRDNRNSASAINGFLLAMSLTLLLSYLVGFGVLKPQPWMGTWCTADDPAIFRSYLLQNTFMALAIFFALLRMRDAEEPVVRVGYGIFALLGIVNVLFMMQGRTGYLTLVALLAWAAWATLSRRMSATSRRIDLRHGVALILVMGLAIASIYFVSSRLQERIDQIATELRAWDPKAGNETSVGTRMELYYNTLQIIRHSPVLGIGTGGLPQAYAEQDKQFSNRHVNNPHNEYLMITVQTGIVGLALMLYLFYTQWRCASFLDSAFNQDAARGLVLATMIDCAFNSTLLDHAPGLLFALLSAALFAGLKAERKHG